MTTKVINLLAVVTWADEAIIDLHLDKPPAIDRPLTTPLPVEDTTSRPERRP